MALFNEMTYFNGVQETVQRHSETLRRPWWSDVLSAHGGRVGRRGVDAPFTWTKQVASSFGGTRNGMVIHWPKRIKAKGEVARAVPSCHRHCTDDSGSCGAAGAESRKWHATGADRRGEHGLHVRHCQGDEPALMYSTARSWATALFMPTAGWPVPCTGHRGRRSHAQRSSMTSGSSTTRVAISA